MSKDFFGERICPIVSDKTKQKYRGIFDWLWLEKVMRYKIINDQEARHGITDLTLKFYSSPFQRLRKMFLPELEKDIKIDLRVK